MKISRNDLPNADLETILIEICDILDIRRRDIVSKTRRREVVHARHLYFYAARQLTRYSLKAVASKVGRDHTTVLNGVKQVKDYLATGDANFMPAWHKYVSKSKLFSKPIKVNNIK